MSTTKGVVDAGWGTVAACFGASFSAFLAANAPNNASCVNCPEAKLVKILSALASSSSYPGTLNHFCTKSG